MFRVDPGILSNPEMSIKDDLTELSVLAWLDKVE